MNVRKYKIAAISREKFQKEEKYNRKKIGKNGGEAHEVRKKKWL